MGGEMITYPIVCPSCNGSGSINNPCPVSSSSRIVCPACNGGKTVMCRQYCDQVYFDKDNFLNFPKDCGKVQKTAEYSEDEKAINELHMKQHRGE